MGLHDIYCTICGGPTYSRPIISDTLLLKKYLGKGNYYGINPNGFWEDAENLINFIRKHYKKLGLNKMNDEDYDILIKSIKIPKNHKWQDKLIMLTEKKNIKNVISAGEVFIEHDGTKYETLIDSNKPVCYVIHNDCYHVLKNKYGKITHNDLKDITFSNLFNKYQGQFSYSSLAYLDDPSLLESPLKNKNNMKNLLNMLKNIKPLKKDIKPLKKDRPSPSESATLFNVGTKKKGNDGNIWIINENKNKIKKWKKISI